MLLFVVASLMLRGKHIKRNKEVDKYLQDTKYFLAEPVSTHSSTGSIVVCIIFIFITIANIIFNFWFLSRRKIRETSKDISNIGLDSNDNANSSIENINDEVIE